MKRLIYLLIPLVLLSLFFTGCGEEKKEKEIIRPVRYQQVYLTGGDRSRVFTGTAKAGIESNLSFRVGGTIKELRVKVGDLVKRGDVLALLDPKDFKLKVSEAEAGLKQAESQELNAKNAYDRARALYENKNIALAQLESARMSFETASAMLERQKNLLELSKSQLAYTKLSAPLDGSIASITLEENEFAGAGKPVMVLTSEGKTEVEVSVPEVLISRIKAGDRVLVTFAAIKEKNFRGEVTEVGISTGRYSTTYPVTVRIDNPDKNIRPGMSADVVFRFEEPDKKMRIIVPPSSVGEDEKGRYVFIAVPGDDGTGTANKQVVTVGDLTGEGLEVLEGIQDGDLIITAGVTRIHDKQKVKLIGF